MLRLCCLPSFYRTLIIRGLSSVPRGKQLIGVTHQTDNEPLGLFRIPGLITANDFMRLSRNKITNAQEIVKDIISSPIERDPLQIIYKFDRLSSELCSIADPCNFLHITLTTPEIYRAAETTSLAITSYVETLNTYPQLYLKLKQCVDKFSHMWSTEENRVAMLLLKDFETSGVHLPEKHRSQILQLQSKETKVGMEYFSQALSPAHVGQWIIEDGYTLSLHSHIRKTVYKAYYKLDVNNLAKLHELLNTRYKLARLLGYQSTAHRSIADSMAREVGNVETLLEKCSESLRPIALEQVQQAREIALSLIPNIKPSKPVDSNGMRAYDGAFYINYARNNIWKKQTESLETSTSLLAALSEYFPLRNCLEAINIICQSLYKMSFEPLAIQPNETWHSSVIKAGLVNSEGLQGVLYLDLMNRLKKTDIECHQQIQGSRRDEQGRYQLPVAALACNFISPLNDDNTLINPINLNSFFHEMGHALHSVLGNTTFQHVAGTRCPNDLAEIPSNLMELYLLDPRFVKVFATHYKTGNSISDLLVQLHIQRSTIFGAYSTHVQVLYGLLDLMLHKNEFKNENDILELEKQLYKNHCVFSQEENTSWALRFSHLTNYGSKYYSYTWAKAFASLFWSKKFAKNPLCPIIGAEYREKFLSHGFGKDPWEMVKDFLGFKPSVNDLLDSLLHDVKSDRSSVHERSSLPTLDYKLKWDKWRMSH
ncbi:Mitochondrial intermediate peptidase-like [Oopsacas minuta]|uniref:Mitochondrial intermediate peptidase-like n=1 Tax=Oopsacas minuta TaxID=111878 RepID=A0AAV7JGT9_9METZ|nr:Mitochondrial intermediate peptidase-like [Oopsacas minuta]